MLDSNNTQMNELMIDEFPFLLVRHTYARLYQHPHVMNGWMDEKMECLFLFGMSLLC
jgi:hypothetical protein